MGTHEKELVVSFVVSRTRMQNEEDESLAELVDRSITPLSILSNTLETNTQVVYELRQEDYFDLLNEGLKREKEEYTNRYNTDTHFHVPEPPNIAFIPVNDTELSTKEHLQQAKKEETVNMIPSEKKLIFGGRPYRRTRKGPEDEFQTQFTFK